MAAIYPEYSVDRRGMWLFRRLHHNIIQQSTRRIVDEYPRKPRTARDMVYENELYRHGWMRGPGGSQPGRYRLRRAGNGGLGLAVRVQNSPLSLFGPRMWGSASIFERPILCKRVLCICKSLVYRVSLAQGRRVLKRVFYTVSAGSRAHWRSRDKKGPFTGLGEPV